ncbi:MAG: hypothetical protein GF355_05065 [Candidatus Eisenbacteria bacterium]|nr:hypothetical protein [Candidatus Eisenbacteria bacterium]
MGKWLLSAALALGAAASPAAGIDITLLGSWAARVDIEDPATGRWDRRDGTHESAVDEVVLAIFNSSGPGDAWRLDVRRVDTHWPESLTLWIRCSDPGLGPGSVDGGSLYQEVTPQDTPLCSGRGDRSVICIQLRLTGTSPEVSPSHYLSSVVYTVVDES